MTKLISDNDPNIIFAREAEQAQRVARNIAAIIESITEETPSAHWGDVGTMREAKSKLFAALEFLCPEAASDDE